MKLVTRSMALCVGLWVASLASVTHAATIGRTPGTFAVTSTGAATYSIPIWAPPGPKGIQPAIALVYNSQAGNGYLGVGWNLAGFSSISRCNLTFAQDAAPAPVSLSTGDGYCLDGQRLRLTGGTYGTAGSTYQTEIANFKNVTACGTAGSGPSYFTVQTPDGHTYQYGNGGNSQVLANGTSTALAWMLNEVSDPAGNTMTVSYSTATGAVVPSTISWTPTSHGSSSYNYTMQFSYGANVLPTAGYVAGTAVQNPNLLGSITVNYSGTQVKEYILSYQVAGTSGRDRLYQVQECASSTSNCLNPTTITYQDGGLGVTTSAATPVTSPLPSTSGALSARYDFNGDGYKDLLYEVGTTWYVAFGSATGYGTPVNTGITGGSLTSTLLAGDLVGAGKDGILANNGGTWYYYTWNGSYFVSTSTGLAFDISASQFALADINGDGLPDLVANYAAGGAYVTTRLNTSSAGSPSFSSSTVPAFGASGISSILLSPDSQSGNLRYFDFDGDGRQDLAISIYRCIYMYGPTCTQYGTWIFTLTSQTGGTFAYNPVGLYLGVSSTYVAFANVNNDACTDVITNQTNIAFSICGGTWGTPLTATYPIVAVMDWNGDGLADLIEQSGGTMYVQLATATGFAAAQPISLSYSSNCTYVTFDANGDGLDDLGCMSSAAKSNGFTYYGHNDGGVQPDLLTNIVDANGNSASPTYASIVQSNYTAGIGTFPDVSSVSPMCVTSSVTFSDPSSASGGTYNQSFEYYASQRNLQGRGWDGFAEFSITDSRNGLTEYRGQFIGFPYTSLPSYDNVQSGSQTISTVTSTQVATTLSSTPYQQRYFPYLSYTSARQYELGGPENGDLITTASTSYTYDNYGNATSVAKTTTDNDPGSSLNGDTWTVTTTNTPDPNTTTWCLNLFTQTQVVYTASVGSPVTRTKQFTPDLANCRYTQVVTEPSSGTYKVTESLGYDAFGNINSDAVTGISMTARTTAANWGTTGQFPMSVTDPSGAQTQFNHNFSYGKISSLTDPNNLTTSWQYTDGFGRKTQETRPDGTYTVWSYLDCTTLNQCPLQSHELSVSHWINASNGMTITDGTTSYDAADRAILSNVRILASSPVYNQNETLYDSLGRVAQVADPCPWSYSSRCPYWTTTSYDTLNRVTQVQRPTSSTNSTPESTYYSYAGRTTTVTDPNSHQTTLISDVNGWRRQTKDPLSYAVNFAHDAAGANTAVTDSLGNTLWTGSYAYGLQAFLTNEADMDRGTWSYVYDALGERTSWTDAKSQSFSETYDALSRPLTRTEPDLFSQWTWGSNATNHNWGQLQSDCTGAGSACNASGYAEAFSFDSLGRKYQRAITLPGLGTYTYTWQYDANTGLLNTLTYPTIYSYALTLQYGYQNGFLQSVTDISDSPNVTVWTANAANPANQITQETLGNGIVVNRSYDAVTQWLNSVQSGVAGGSGVQNQSFLFDLVGNVTQRQDGNLGLTENLYYDYDNRLTSSTLNSTTNLSIGYDGTGNITSRSDVASGATWTYDPVRKHAVTQAGSSAYAYAYDANGNATSRQGSTIAWFSYNYPNTVSAGSGSTAETASFVYAPDRSRWQQTYIGNGTKETTSYIGGLADYVNSGKSGDFRNYIYAGTEPVAVYSNKNLGGRSLSYLLSDHQGSVASITNSSGSVDVAESFTPFGNRRNPATWSGAASNSDLTTAAGLTRQGYTFQTQLGLWMGLNHMNGRVQDAITGRFLSADPQGIDVNNTQSFNRYSYVTNNPLTQSDPSGFCGENDLQSIATIDNPGVDCLQWIHMQEPGWGASISEPGNPDNSALEGAMAANGQGFFLQPTPDPSDNANSPNGVSGANQNPSLASPDTGGSQFGAPDKGSVPCADSTCSFKIYPYVDDVNQGVYIKVDYNGNMQNVSWIQAYNAYGPGDNGDNTQQDCQFTPCPFTVPAPTPTFEDEPTRTGQAGSWVAQLSLVAPNAAGSYTILATVTYGFAYAGGKSYPIKPSVAAPSNFQQQSASTAFWVKW